MKHLIAILTFTLFTGCSQLGELIIRNETNDLLKGTVFLHGLDIPGEQFTVPSKKEYTYATFDIKSGEENKIRRQIVGLNITDKNGCVIKLTNKDIVSITTDERSPSIIVRIQEDLFTRCAN